MKILLTGGLGYIGSHTAVELNNSGYEVVIVDNLSNSQEKTIDSLEKIIGKKIKFYKTDLLDYNEFEKIFNEQKIDGVIHFAGFKSINESISNSLEYYENNLVSTINLLKLMKKYNVNNLIFSSSACVYAQENKSPIDENGKLGVTHPYGKTKLFIENIIEDYCKSNLSFRAILLRYFNPVGAHSSGLIGENPNNIPNNLMPYISKVACGKLEQLSIFGNDYDTKDGTGVRDFIHITDLAKGHLCALKNIENLNGCNVFNLGTGTGYSVLEMVTEYNKICGNKVKFVIAERRKGDLACVYANPSKAEKILGFKATKTLREMCESAYNFEKNNQ